MVLTKSRVAPVFPLPAPPPQPPAADRIRALVLQRPDPGTAWGLNFRRNVMPLTVTAVRAGTIAHRLGFKEGDVIVAVDGSCPATFAAAVDMFKGTHISVLVRSGTTAGVPPKATVLPKSNPDPAMLLSPPPLARADKAIDVSPPPRPQPSVLLPPSPSVAETPVPSQQAVKRTGDWFRDVVGSRQHRRRVSLEGIPSLAEDGFVAHADRFDAALKRWLSKPDAGTVSSLEHDAMIEGTVSRLSGASTEDLTAAIGRLKRLVGQDTFQQPTSPAVTSLARTPNAETALYAALVSGR